jgi:hypothetical protein
LGEPQREFSPSATALLVFQAGQFIPLENRRCPGGHAASPRGPRMRQNFRVTAAPPPVNGLREARRSRSRCTGGAAQAGADSSGARSQLGSKLVAGAVPTPGDAATDRPPSHSGYRRNIGYPLGAGLPKQDPGLAGHWGSLIGFAAVSPRDPEPTTSLITPIQR